MCGGWGVVGAGDGECDEVMSRFGDRLSLLGLGFFFGFTSSSFFYRFLLYLHASRLRTAHAVAELSLGPHERIPGRLYGALDDDREVCRGIGEKHEMAA